MDDDLPQFSMNPRLSGAGNDPLAQVLAENLDRLSLDELDQRVAQLEAEIIRVKAHKSKSSAHRLAAESLFKSPN